MQIYETKWSKNQIYLFKSNNIHILNLLWPALRNNLIFRSELSTGAPSNKKTGTTQCKIHGKNIKVNSLQDQCHMYGTKADEILDELEAIR